MPRGRGSGNRQGPTGELGFERQLWSAADALRNNMDAAEYKHVVLELIFLKYISDAFEAKHAALEAARAEGADPEDPDEYRAESIFWVPKEARWSHLKASAPQPTIGTLVDEAMSSIERDNPTLKGVLPKDYARPGSAWSGSSTSCRTSVSSALPIGRRTSWGASTSTSSPSSPAPRARRAASSTRLPRGARPRRDAGVPPVGRMECPCGRSTGNGPLGGASRSGPATASAVFWWMPLSSGVVVISQAHAWRHVSPTPESAMKALGLGTGTAFVRWDLGTGSTLCKPIRPAVRVA